MALESDPCRANAVHPARHQKQVLVLLRFHCALQQNIVTIQHCATIFSGELLHLFRAVFTPTINGLYEQKFQDVHFFFPSYKNLCRIN
jgi:hypothetical protein